MLWNNHAFNSLMKTTSVFRFFPFVVLGASTVMADPGAKTDQAGARAVTAIWEQADVNQDGFLSFDEFAALGRIARLSEDEQRRVFQRFDKDGDGKISQREFRVMRRSDGQQRSIRRLMELDRDGSGGVNLEEFRSGEMFAKMAPERVEALFRKLDADGDGEITPKDRPELPPIRGQRKDVESNDARPEMHRRIFNQLDADQSGMLKFSEFQGATGLTKMDEDAQEALFMRLDRNQDLQLSFEEFSKLPLRQILPQPRVRDEDARPNRPSRKR